MSVFAVPGSPGLFQCRIEQEPVPLPRARIARVLGYGAAVPEYVEDALDTVCADLERACQPMGGFRVFPGSAGADGFRCDGQAFATGPEIARQLDRSERLALFVATVGRGFEQLRQDYASQDEPLLGYVLDAAGSEWADQVADRVEREVRSLAKAEGLSISNRYSPGYCGWKVSEQHGLFALLPGDFCSISLNPSAMMTPMKSVSGVIGLGRGIQYSAYRCELCDLRETCRGRSRRPAKAGAAQAGPALA